MDVPSEYVGREQTWLKHRVLHLYLEGWAHKLASFARHRSVRLWYVDCFSGPWKAQDQDLQDTSISIGLRALESASRTWAAAQFPIELGAIFVERNPKAFAALEEFLARASGDVRTFPLLGSFGERLSDIQNKIGGDPAFLFVDPTFGGGHDLIHFRRLVRSSCSAATHSSDRRKSTSSLAKAAFRRSDECYGGGSPDRRQVAHFQTAAEALSSRRRIVATVARASWVPTSTWREGGASYTAFSPARIAG